MEQKWQRLLILDIVCQSLSGSPEWPQNQANGQNFFTPNYNIVPSWSNKQHTLSFHKMFLFSKTNICIELEITYESKFSIFSFLFLTNKKVLINLGRVLISYQKKRDLLLLVSLYSSKLFLKKLKTWLIDLIKGPTFYKWANIIYCGKVVYSTWSLSYMYISFTTYLH